MKILFIIDESNFFIPNWLDLVITALMKKHQIIAITPLDNKHIKTWDNHIIQYLPIFGLQQIAMLGLYVLFAKVKQVLFDLGLYKKPTNVTQVAKKHKIKIIQTKSVNDNNYLSKLSKLKPDVIFCSCSQIFNKKLLALPKVACINRHTSLLPSYAGILPIFWMMLNNETHSGISIHHMTSQIDRGKIVYQSKFKIKKTNSLYSLFQQFYEEGVDASIQAINTIDQKLNPMVIKGGKSSYNSYPEKKDWIKFFQKDFKII